jgi:intein/homing endonuclease
MSTRPAPVARPRRANRALHLASGHRQLSYPVVPVLRASNGAGLIHPDDRKYGSLLVGGQGSGKCIGPDDLVLLAGRLIRAEDAWDRYAGRAIHDGEGWWSAPLEQPLTCSLDRRGRIVAAPVVRLYRQRINERVRRVRLSDGSQLTITGRHRLCGPDGWTTTVHEGDVICVPRRIDWPGTRQDLDLVELLAWQIAEGCETHDAKRSRRGSAVATISQARLGVLQRLRDLAVRIGERYGLSMNSLEIRGTRTCWQLTIQSAAWRDYLVSRGYQWGRLSREKSIPDFVMQGDLEAARTFLRAFTDAEGSVADQNRTVELTTASPMLAEQVRALLRRFGILASLRARRAAASNGHRITRDYRRLTISGDSLRTFLAEIGFGAANKDDRLARMLAGVKKNSNREGIYTQDILREAKSLGLPFKWICDHWGYLDTRRASQSRARDIAQRLRGAAHRLDAGRYVSPGARGVAASSTRTATLATLDTERLRALARTLERRIESEVFYLTIEAIEEFQHDGWVYDFEVPGHHNYVAGGMLAHNTAAMLRLYLNDLRDPDAAIVVLDPKSELSQLCLRFTPPDCPKTVWFLDLGHPLFGMSPLRLTGQDPLPVQATAIAENVVASLLDINEGQIFQSSRRYLYHAVIGALALAAKQNRRAKFEDIYTLLLPTKDDFRHAVYEACADTPDLDQTAEFFHAELPEDLRLAGSAIAQRLDAPRNKVSLLTGVPPLRRFFNHTSDVALRDIIEARGILIVDANMAAIGPENAKACMHFVLRMLHSQLQRQVRLPETDRPRVALLVDEAHYVASAENVVDQIATHRAAGLDVTFGMQYLAQLGAGSQVQEKIRKGVINLLQSRFLFRLGDAQDAEEVTRIAMAVYSTMIRDDPDSRGRMRVTPEQILNLPNHFCLASWIANGARAPSFIGETYPFPATTSPAWAELHLQRLRDRVEPYPDELESTLDTRPHSHPSSRRTDGDSVDGAQTRHSNGNAPDPPRRDIDEHDLSGADASPKAADARREPRVQVRAHERTATPSSPVRRIVGRRAADLGGETRARGPAPASLRDLAFVDRINDLAEPVQKPPAAKLPRLYDEDYAILALLDRTGLVLPNQIHRAVSPSKTAAAVRSRLTKLYGAGLVARVAIGVRNRSSGDGRLPSLYTLTRHGLQTAQQRQPPAIHAEREWRPIEQRKAARLAHDLRALSWAIELHHVVGDLATDYWRTPRYATGRFPVPQIGAGHKRHALTLRELPTPDGHALLDIALPEFSEIKPDIALELRVQAMKLTFDLLVELDVTGKPSYNHDKFLAYDAFLSGWCMHHRRYKQLGTPPAVIFVCATNEAALKLARDADETMTGRLGPMGAPEQEWSFPGREHLFFAAEEDIHHGSLAALALPRLPPSIRARLTDSRTLELSCVDLLPPSVVRAAKES